MGRWRGVGGKSRGRVGWLMLVEMMLVEMMLVEMMLVVRSRGMGPRREWVQCGRVLQLLPCKVVK